MYKFNEEEKLALAKRYINVLSAQPFEVPTAYSEEAGEKFRGYLKGFQQGTRVLHIGAGPGREVLVSLALGLDAYGVTLSRTDIAVARTELNIGPDRLVFGSCELLTFPTRAFEVVIGCQIFEHATSPIMMLLEAGRVLKDNGKIILEWPAASEHGTNGEDPQHQICYTPGQAKGLLLKAGFGGIELRYQHAGIVPESEYWQGHQDKGYVIATASKIDSARDFVNNSRNF